MKIFMHNTRDLSTNHDLKEDHLRCWIAMLSGMDRHKLVPRASMTGKRCKIRTTVVKTSYDLFVKAGMLEQVGEDFRVTREYVGFEDLGRGSVPIYSGKLRAFAKDRILKLASLRLLYFLLDDLRRGNKILNTNITEASAAIGSNRVTSALAVGSLKDLGIIEEHKTARSVPPYGKKYYQVTRDFLGAIKR